MIGGSDRVERVNRRKGRRKVKLSAMVEVLEEGYVLSDDTSGRLGEVDTFADDEVEAGGERGGGGRVEKTREN